MTPRRPSRTPSAEIARRGVLLGGPAALLAGCGLFSPEEPTPPPPTTAVLDIDLIEIIDPSMLTPMLGIPEVAHYMRHPRAGVQVEGWATKERLSAEEFTALTGQEAPPVDGGGADGETPRATTLLPGEGKVFLMIKWGVSDPRWPPTPAPHVETELSVRYEGREAMRLDPAPRGEERRAHAVLTVQDIEFPTETLTVRARTQDEVHELSLTDGLLVDTGVHRPTPAPSGTAVEVADAGVLDLEIPGRDGQEGSRLHGTVEQAFRSTFVDAGEEYGEGLGWSEEGQIYLVVLLTWDREGPWDVTDRSEVVLELPDGTQLSPVQDQALMFGSTDRQPIATFTVPTELESATVRITPRFARGDGEEQVEESLTATLTVIEDW